MKIGFYIHRLVLNEYHSVAVLMAVLKKHGYHPRLWVGNSGLKPILPEIISFQPELICYSICSNEAETYLAVNRAIKRHLPFHSIFGGPHPTYFPAFIEEESVDMICVGEGEAALVELLANFNTDRRYSIENIYFKKIDGEVVRNKIRPLLADLDQLPFPDRDTLFSCSPLLAQLPVKTFFAGRGCPYKCSYCFNHRFNQLYKGLGKILRQKSVGFLFREINHIRESYPMSFVRFCDDNFGIDKAWLEEFSERYPREVGLPFSCYTRPNLVNDRYVAALFRSGCASVYMGIECGNEEMRRKILCRNLTNEQIIDASERLHRAGIKLCSLNMIGLPGETVKIQEELLELNRKCGSDYADISIFQPFPGTEIFSQTTRMGYLDNDSSLKFSGQFGNSILRWPASMQKRLNVLVKLFDPMVHNPKLYLLAKHPALLSLMTMLQPLLNLFSKVYHGYFLQRRIFPVRIPWKLQMRGLYYMVKFGRGETSGSAGRE